jgi:hypothetical protein
MTVKFQLTIECGDGCDERTDSEVARILRTVADKLDLEVGGNYCMPLTMHAVGGKPVGTATYVHERGPLERYCHCGGVYGPCYCEYGDLNEHPMSECEVHALMEEYAEAHYSKEG